MPSDGGGGRYGGDGDHGGDGYGGNGNRSYGGSDWDSINAEIDFNSDTFGGYGGNGPTNGRTYGDSMSGFAGQIMNEQMGYSVAPQRESAPGYGLMDMFGDYSKSIPTPVKIFSTLIPGGSSLLNGMTGVAALAHYMGYDVGPGDINTAMPDRQRPDTQENGYKIKEQGLMPPMQPYQTKQNLGIADTTGILGSDQPYIEAIKYLQSKGVI